MSRPDEVSADPHASAEQKTEVGTHGNSGRGAASVLRAMMQGHAAEPARAPPARAEPEAEPTPPQGTRPCR
jgi:hypothetical protein